MKHVDIEQRTNSVTIFIDGVGVGGLVGSEEVIKALAPRISPQQADLKLVVDNTKPTSEG